MAHFVMENGEKLELNLFESLEISKEKLVSGLYQVVVSHMDKPSSKVVVRVKVDGSMFVFVWSSQKISEEAKKAICSRMTDRFWG
jgi:phenylpyruvate tautomerase PptA (4-oxalocrotonate tautomerase family)